jgi:hypothetical protein
MHPFCQWSIGEQAPTSWLVASGSFCLSSRCESGGIEMTPDVIRREEVWASFVTLL